MTSLQRIYKKLDSLSTENFEELSVEIFHFQYERNSIYKSYVDGIKKSRDSITKLTQIPFLPIEFFKKHKVTSKEVYEKPEAVFYSSGTTSSTNSKHLIFDLNSYHVNSRRLFEEEYGSLGDYIILAFLPSYLDNGNSSLVAMVGDFIEATGNALSAFFKFDLNQLLIHVDKCREQQPDKKILIWGVSYALLDLAEKFKPNLEDCIIMETGGMKGRRKEMTKEQLHHELCEGLGVEKIHSEYGMTELLSQCYSQGNGIFNHSKTMKVLARDINDPFDVKHESPKTAALNVIDLANINSCCFIETKDLGVVSHDSFFVQGRMDNSDVRGCNLLYDL